MDNANNFSKWTHNYLFYEKENQGYLAGITIDEN